MHGNHFETLFAVTRTTINLYLKILLNIFNDQEKALLR